MGGCGVGGSFEAASGLVTPCRPGQKELQKAGGARSRVVGTVGLKMIFQEYPSAETALLLI